MILFFIFYFLFLCYIASFIYTGYEVYLVGGCVRDLILKRTPKDFDIITSADLKEVLSPFHFCTFWALSVQSLDASVNVNASLFIVSHWECACLSHLFLERSSHTALFSIFFCSCYQCCQFHQCLYIVSPKLTWNLL